MPLAALVWGGVIGGNVGVSVAFPYYVVQSVLRVAELAVVFVKCGVNEMVFHAV